MMKSIIFSFVLFFTFATANFAADSSWNIRFNFAKKIEAEENNDAIHILMLEPKDNLHKVEYVWVSQHNDGLYFIRIGMKRHSGFSIDSIENIESILKTIDAEKEFDQVNKAAKDPKYFAEFIKTFYLLKIIDDFVVNTIIEQVNIPDFRQN